MTEETLKEKCIRLEHFETPEWAARAILEREKLSGIVIDPCCGTGILARAAMPKYVTIQFDIHDWGTQGLNLQDFLKIKELKGLDDFDIFMNPPFSKACEFIEQSFGLGARKVLCFQRFAWWESRKRKAFWEKHPPARVYICGDRAHCWRHDIPHEQRTSSSPTAHAWFVFERGHKGGTMLDHIWKGDQ